MRTLALFSVGSGFVLLGCQLVAHLADPLEDPAGAGGPNGSQQDGSAGGGDGGAGGGGGGGGGGSDATSSVDGGPCDRTAPFRNPQPVAELNSSGDQQSARLSADELTVTFGSTRTLTDASGSTSQFFTATRASRTAKFGAPVAVSVTNFGTGGQDPNVSPDGLTLYYGKRVATSNYDVFFATRTSTTVGFGAPLGVTGLATASSEYRPYMTSNGAALYFASNREGAGKWSVYRTPITGPGAVGAAQVIAELGSSVDSVAVSSDELTIVYGVWASDLHLWQASRPSTSVPFSPGVMLQDLNGSLESYPDWISPDGCRLYFSSDRPGAGPGYMNIWIATR